jgi:hypothetical protein
VASRGHSVHGDGCSPPQGGAENSCLLLREDEVQLWRTGGGCRGSVCSRSREVSRGLERCVNGEEEKSR